jgi:hypothetical protein
MTPSLPLHTEELHVRLEEAVDEATVDFLCPMAEILFVDRSR